MKQLAASLLLALIACLACGGNDSDEDQISIFNVWQTDSTSYIGVINFREGEFGVPFDVTGVGEDVVCTCTVLVSGDEDAGTYEISGCAPVEDGCDAVEQTGSFERLTETSIRICDDAQPTCAVYRCGACLRI